MQNNSAKVLIFFRLGRGMVWNVSRSVGNFGSSTDQNRLIGELRIQSFEMEAEGKQNNPFLSVKVGQILR